MGFAYPSRMVFSDMCPQGFLECMIDPFSLAIRHWSCLRQRALPRVRYDMIPDSFGAGPGHLE
jgi:hypothetical protein